MENEEDFLRAAAILKELDLQLVSLSESAINKAQVEIRREIETNFEKCVKALNARKESLLREVDTKFQDKRKQQATKEHEVKTTIETCRKLLLAGVAVYNKDKHDEAVNIWKSLTEFKPNNGESDQIRVSFSDSLLSSVADYGLVSAAYVESPRLGKSSSSSVEPHKLGKSSSFEPPTSKSRTSSNAEPPTSKLRTSSTVEPPTSKLRNSSNIEPPATKLGKSSSTEAPTSKLSKSTGVEPPTSRLSKSSSTEPPKLNKSANVEPPTTKLGKSSTIESPKVVTGADTPSPGLRLSQLDKIPNLENPTKLGKTSTDNSRIGKEGPLKVSLESPRMEYKPTLSDSPRGEKKVASQNKVTTLTELNYGLEGRIGSNAQLRHPNGICFNPHDRSLCVTDNGHIVFKVTPTGETKIFAAKRGDNQLYNPMGITCYLKENCFFVTSQLQHCIKMINSTGIVTLMAGCGKEGSQDGIGLKSGFSHPVGITVDQLTGDLYVSDFGNHTIRKISQQGVVTTLAGTAGKKGFADGVGKTAVFNCPLDISFNDKDQSLVVCDSNNNKVRRVALNGEVTTIGEISRPSSIAITPNGSFLVSSLSEHKIYHLFKGSGGYKIETIAGTGRKGGEDGNGAECSFNGISGIALDEKSNVCYVAEHEFSRIRKIQLQF